MTERPRNVAVSLEHFLLGVAGVAAENLVAAVAGEEDFDPVLARDLGADVSRRRGVVAEGLVVGAGDDRYGFDDILRRHVILASAGAQMLRRDARVLHLVEAF